MFRQFMIKGSIALFLVVLLTASGLVSAAVSVEQILKQADNYRLSAESVEVTTRVRLFKTVKQVENNQAHKERLYQVLLKPGRRSLVLFKSPGEAGQKVLMLDDRFWLLMPKSRRPIRITPMQKLLGEASTGDISSLTWSEDYQGIISGETDYKGRPAIELELTAKVKGASYQMIKLRVDKISFQPLHAYLYLKSGKLAKEVIYHLGELKGEPRITRLTLLDRIASDKRTQIDYLEMNAVSIPDKVYNPAYLVRNPNLSL